MLHQLLLLGLLPLSLASTLTGFSTTSHFHCTGISCPPTTPTTLSTLLTSLTSASSTAPDLPLNPIFTKPALSLLIDAPPTAPHSILHALSTATNTQSPTSFTSPAHLSSTTPTHTLQQLAHIAKRPTLFPDSGPALIHLAISQPQVPALLSVISDLAKHPDTAPGLVILWSTRQDADQPPPQDDAADADPAAPPQDPVAEGDKDVAHDPDADDHVAENVMRPPEIDASQLAGLLVAFVFLLIFVPGFLCLSNIQPPQTFEAFDAADAKKKMQ